MARATGPPSHPINRALRSCSGTIPASRTEAGGKQQISLPHNTRPACPGVKRGTAGSTGDTGPGLRTPGCSEPGPARAITAARPSGARGAARGRTGPCPGRSPGPTARPRTDPAGPPILRGRWGARTHRHSGPCPTAPAGPGIAAAPHRAAAGPRPLPVPHSPAMAAPAPPGPRAAASGLRPSAFLPGRAGARRGEAGRPALGTASSARRRWNRAWSKRSRAWGRRSWGSGARGKRNGARSRGSRGGPPWAPWAHTGIPIALSFKVKLFFKCLCSLGRPVQKQEFTLAQPRVFKQLIHD